jgi:hypothetical protein
MLNLLNKIHWGNHPDLNLNAKCGTAQLNTHFEDVSDHEDKHDLVFSGTFHVFEAARRQC